MGQDYPDNQYIDIIVGGQTRRALMKVAVFADGSLQKTFWINGLNVIPDFEPELDEYRMTAPRYSNSCSPGCGCNTCRQSCPPPSACDTACRPPNIRPVPVMPGVVSGEPRIGATLAYDPVIWQGALASRAYWYRGSVRMHSAKSPYTITEADRGFVISVLETGFGMGVEGTNPVRSNLVGPVGDASGEVPTQVFTQPVITGTAFVGSVLTYTRGVWIGTPTPDVQAYWQRGDGSSWADIGAANTGIPYTVTSSDIGFRLRIREVARNTPSLITAVSNLTDVITQAAPVAPTVQTPPVIAGTAAVGASLTYSPGMWSGTPAPTIVARWFAGTADLGAAVMGVPFQIPSSAAGQQIRVQETATNTHSTRVSQSNSIGPIEAEQTPPLNSYPPAVGGNAMVGQGLTYIGGTWSGNPMPTISAVWQQETDGVWSAIGTATPGVPLTMTSAHVGHRFRVLETAVGSSTASLASAAVGPAIVSTNVPPAVTNAAVITGTPTVGSALTYTMGVWSGVPGPIITAQWQRQASGGAWTNIGAATAGTPYTLTSTDAGALIRVLETAVGSSTTTGPSNVLGPVVTGEVENTIYSFRGGENTWEVRPAGLAAGANTRTFRPFLPWNHQGTAAAFNPINNCPQVYVFPQMLGTDNNPLNVNPFSEAPGGGIRITSAQAAPGVQSRIVWPGSANSTVGYWTSGSLSLMGIMQAQYGRFRARMRFTETLGRWPEMWIVPAWGEGADFEIDAELNTNLPDKVSFNAFKTDFVAGTTQGWVMANGETIWLDLPDGAEISEYIDYEFHWTKDFIRFYANDVLMREIVDHGFHTPGTVLFSFASGNGDAGWQPLPQVGQSADPSFYDIQQIEWKQAPSDIANMPVQVSRPTVGSSSGGTVAPGSVVTVTPAVVTGGTLLKREWILGRRIIPGLTGTTVTVPADLDSYTSLPAGSWIPFNCMETYTNPQGGITIARSSDVLYRVVGQPAAPSSDWAVGQQRITGQDIGGAEWYKYGITMAGNTVTETTATSEHGVGLSGMQRSAGAIRIRCEAVVSGVAGHTQLQMQVAPGDWSQGANALFTFPSGVGATANNGWTVVSSAHDDLGGGRHRLEMVLDVDASTIGFVWLLRGFVGGMASYAGSTSRSFTLESSRIERIASGSTPAPTPGPTPAPTPAPTSDWVVDGERIVSQDIGGAEWYKTGVTVTGNSVVETATTGEHGVGLSGLPRSAGAIRVQCEAVISGVTGYDSLQFQIASGDWSQGANAVLPVAGGAGVGGNSGWTPIASSLTDIGGGQKRLVATFDLDAASTGFVWLLRGYVGGVSSYAGSATRGFTLVSSSIKRIATDAPPAPTPTPPSGPVNMVTSTDFTTAGWTKAGVTATADTITEDSADSTHGLEYLNKPRAAGAKTYRVEFDIETTSYVGFSVEVAPDGWAHMVGAIYDFATNAVVPGSEAATGSWTNGAMTVSAPTGNVRHISHTFTTDATSTNFNLLLRGVSGTPLGRSYVGNGARSAKITNLKMTEI